MVITIGLFMLTLFFINITVINTYKEEVLFKQLKEAFSAKFIKDPHESSYSEQEGIVLINHFSIVFDEQQNKQIVVDKFTHSTYGDARGQRVIMKIAEFVTFDTDSDTKGSIDIDHTKYLYYVQWLEEDQMAMVFFTPFIKEDVMIWVILGLFLTLMFISFFASRIVARALAKPIQELEKFAEETAQRHWEAKVPITDPDEIGMLARSLEQMRDSLKRAEERDREFLQSTSHDLKTPVMIIKGYAQSIIDKMTTDDGQGAALVIVNESNRLERRITQLLRLNTLGHSLEYKERREIISIDRLIKVLVNHCKVISPQLEWNLDLQSFECLGDAEGLRIAFENLLDNQMRYAKSKISVSMRQNISDEKIGRQIIRIENDGAAFAVDDPMVLFDAYKKDAEGKFGLGLAIVQQVIQSHEGTINAFNTETGVAFEMSLPYLRDCLIR